MLKFIARQYRRPEGLLGEIISGRMERKNEKTYNWVIPFIDTADNDKLLEVGFGTGLGINVLAEKNKNTKIYGIDLSKVMILKAKKRNQYYINDKRVFLSCGDLLDYNMENDFNRILSINVLYFWNELNIYFNKIYNLLKEKGIFYLYMSSPERLDKIVFTRNEIFNKYTKDDVIKGLEKAKFKKIRYETNETNTGNSYLIISEKSS